MLHTQLAALSLAGMTLAVSGCGGSSKTTSTETASAKVAPAPTESAKPEPTPTESAKPLTRTDLITRGDAICGRVNLKRTTTPVVNGRDFARIVPEIAAYEQAAVAEMAKLIPPASMTNDWKRIVAGTQVIADDTTKVGEYAVANKLQAARPLYLSGTKIQKRILIIAKRDGFKECSHVS